jgi:hypothetical protein
MTTYVRDQKHFAHTGQILSYNDCKTLTIPNAPAFARPPAAN